MSARPTCPASTWLSLFTAGLPIIDVKSKHAGFREALLEVYVPRYGPQWEEFLDSGPLYARIDANRMFTFHAGDGTGRGAARRAPRCRAPAGRSGSPATSVTEYSMTMSFGPT